MSKVGGFGLAPPPANGDAERARGLGGKLQAARTGHRQARQFGNDGAEAAVPKPFLETGEDSRLVASLDIDHPAGWQTGLGERGREEVLARDTPQDPAARPGGDAGGPQGGRSAVDRTVGAAGDFMQRAERQPSSRQYPVNLGDAKWQHLTPTRCPAFQTRHALPEFGQYEMGRGRGHVRRSRLQFWYVLFLFSLAEESIRLVACATCPKLVAFFGLRSLADVRNL